MRFASIKTKQKKRKNNNNKIIRFSNRAVQVSQSAQILLTEQSL